MSDPAADTVSFRVPPWILWLTWIYVVIFGLGVVSQAVSLAIGQSPWTALFGIEVPTLDHVTVGWVLLQVPYVVFAICGIGVLLKDRDFAWGAVITAWVIAIVQSVQAVMQLVHLRISIPISAFLFVAYAVGIKKALRPRRRAGGVVDRGTI